MEMNLQEQEYISRINRVMDYIQANLSKPLTLSELARVAFFSPYHFHRIFSSFTGETLNSFIQRLRIEKAVSLLITHPTKSITEIAFDAGFASSASFARLFKECFGMSATEMRSGGYKNFSKICKAESKNGKLKSKNGKDSDLSIGYFLSNIDGGADRSDEKTKIAKRRNTTMSGVKDVKVIVKDVSSMTVAYVRHIGPYKGNSKLFEDMWGKLVKWAGPRGLMTQPDLKVLNVYHDDPEITDENNLRMSVCISVPSETPVSGEIGKMEIAGGKYAMAHFEISEEEFQMAWDYVYGQWLPKSGYQPGDGPCYELCLKDPKNNPEHKYIVEICVPVQPL